jgi:PAS domain S-box-containing protein
LFLPFVFYEFVAASFVVFIKAILSRVFLNWIRQVLPVYFFIAWHLDSFVAIALKIMPPTIEERHHRRPQEIWLYLLAKPSHLLATSHESSIRKLDFNFLPAFAKFILEQYVEAFARYQLRLYKETEVPLFKYFNTLSEEQQIELSIQSSKQFLTYFRDNKATEQITDGLKRWRENALPLLDKMQVTTEDIFTVNYVRKQAFINFLPVFTSDANQLLEIIREIDAFILEAESASTSMYFSLVYEKLQEEMRMKEEISSTLQRSEQLYKEAQAITHIGNYTWDLRSNELQWSDELYRIYGMDPSAGPVDFQAAASKNHPDDIEHVRRHTEESIATCKPFDFIYRIRMVDSTLKILQAKGEVKTDENGKPVKVIGTTQDVTEVRTLIEQLQRSEKLYKQAQEIAHLGNWERYVNDDVMHASEQFRKIFDFDADVTITLSEVTKRIHPSDLANFKSAVKSTMEQGSIPGVDFRIILRDGTERDLFTRAHTEKDESGKPFKVIGTVQDVTSQKRVERQLRENQNFIQKIADATPSIITSYNIKTGEYRFVSRGLKKLLGWEPSLPLENGIQWFVGIIHPDDMPSISEANAKALELANAEPEKHSGLVAEFQYRMKNAQGEYRWFHTYGTIFDRDEENNVEHVLNISLDITERLQAEQKIRDQEHFIEHVADASPTVLYVFDAEQARVVYINHECQNVIGYTPDEIIEMGEKVVANLYHPEDYEKIAERLHQYNRSSGEKGLFQFECRMRHKDGDWRWLLVREVIFRTDGSRRITQILGAALDITERKVMEDNLFQKTIELEQSNTSLEEFAYVTSHDLQEPLRKISTFGDRLMKKQFEVLNDEGRDYLDKIVQSSLRAQQMIQDLLSVSTISGDKGFVRYDLEQLLKEVYQALEYKIEEKKAEIRTSTLPQARIVPSQFRQLFQNLIGNALKFARTDGMVPKVTIAHDYLYGHQVSRYNLQKASRYLKISVKDNGIGFDKRFAEKIFVIFQRLHHKRDYEGTGIGLSICKKIVENHGGVIFADGEPGVGAEFTFIIPD